jgi:hypothetical protein
VPQFFADEHQSVWFLFAQIPSCFLFFTDGGPEAMNWRKFGSVVERNKFNSQTNGTN